MDIENNGRDKIDELVARATKKGLTLPKLAAALHVSTSTMYNYVNGYTKPRANVRKRIDVWLERDRIMTILSTYVNRISSLSRLEEIKNDIQAYADSNKNDRRLGVGRPGRNGPKRMCSSEIFFSRAEADLQPGQPCPKGKRLTFRKASRFFFL